MKIYFGDNDPSEPRLVYIDDLAPPPAPKPASPPARHARRPLRNWQVAVVYAMIHTGIVTVIITQASGDSHLGLLSLAWHGAMLFVGLCFGLVAGKL